MDYLMRLYGDELDPLHSGDTKSWFQFYKWQVEGEVHVDISVDDVLYRDIKEKDRLWFVMDRTLIGYVQVLRVVHDPTLDKLEIWYSGEKCYKYEYDLAAPLTENFGTFVPSEVAEEWVKRCKEPS